MCIRDRGFSAGEVVFNTAMTGYQEILTDPSYAGQIVTLTYPHVGNVGVNPEDAESTRLHASGLVIRDLPRLASNFRSAGDLGAHLRANRIVGIADIDTRKLTRILREVKGPVFYNMTGVSPGIRISLWHGWSCERRVGSSISRPWGLIWSSLASQSRQASSFCRRQQCSERPGWPSLLRRDSTPALRRDPCRDFSAGPDHGFPQPERWAAGGRGADGRCRRQECAAVRHLAGHRPLSAGE